MHFKDKSIPFTLELLTRNEVKFVCRDAGIDQIFLCSDIPALLLNLPGLVLMEEATYAKDKRDTMNEKIKRLVDYLFEKYSITQMKILELALKEDISKYSLRQIGERIGEKNAHPQKVKHHLQYLCKGGFMKYNSIKKRYKHGIEGCYFRTIALAEISSKLNNNTENRQSKSD